MYEIIGIMIIGGIIGYVFKSKGKLIRLSEKIYGFALFVLLFSLGLSVGKNEAVMSNISNLGLLSLAIAAAAVAGSIFCAWAVYKIFFKKVNKNK
ncbi:MAG: LysO family transporter [Prevotellaceae bacterium]|nr:LysO family transporter [Prevotellaceae bacterium]